MWHLPEHKRRNTNIPIITQGWQEILHYDGPVLFTGYNALKSRVIGSLVEYEADTKEQKYVHAIIDRGTYVSYLRGEISYFHVLKNAWDLFGLVWARQSESPTVYQIEFEDIPSEYRPDEDSFCPDLDWQASNIYPVALDGKLAALHQALPEVVSQVQEYVTGLYRGALEEIGKMRRLEIDLKLTASAEDSRAYRAASFQMDYGIELKQKADSQTDLFESADIYFDYLNDFITYCLYDLPGEAPKLAADKETEAAGFKSLYNKYAGLCRLKESDKARARERLKKDLLNAFDTLRQLSGTIGPFYTEIILGNVSAGEMRELGIINEVIREKIDLAAKEVEVIQGDVHSEDNAPQKYEIYIYALNTDSRLGFAQVRAQQESKKIPKPKIKVLGDAPLTGTKYTKSLYASEYIEVQAKAKRVNDVIRSMDIFYEES